MMTEDAIRLDERKRIVAILSAPEANGREWAARRIAFCTDLDPAAAIAELLATPLPWPSRPYIVQETAQHGA